MRVELLRHETFARKRFEEQAALIRQNLGSAIQRIEHIGSTAVPELAAKPIVDILLEVPNVTDRGIQRRLEQIGYSLVVDEPGHRMFRSAAENAHVHLWVSGDPEIERHILFRDWLRENERDRRLYEREKHRLAAMEWPTQNDYAQAKTPIVNEIIGRARESRKA